MVSNHKSKKRKQDSTQPLSPNQKKEQKRRSIKILFLEGCTVPEE